MSHSRKDTIVRQSVPNLVSHWLIALSIFSLIVSGMAQMPMAQRYKIADVPGLAWTADFHFTLSLHYLGAIILLFAVTFHITYALASRRFNIFPRRGDFKESVLIIKAMLGKGEEPASHKYLAEKRLAYAFIGGSTLVVLASGALKVAKNVAGVELSSAVIWWATLLHNVSAMLVIAGVAGHLAAFIIKENRALLPAMFTGRVDRAYAEHRHSLWYREVVAQTVAEPIDIVADKPGREAA